VDEALSRRLREVACPDFLCHYYEAAKGPFRSLSDLSVEEAEEILERIRREGLIFASKRPADYLTIRRELEARIRALFIQKGGRPRRATPYSMCLGACAWLLEWYQDGREIRVPLAAFDSLTVSFTYGDCFPAMRYQDGKPYRGQVYTMAELPEVIRLYGLPQEWNKDGKLGPERYIEAQVWDDELLRG